MNEQEINATIRNATGLMADFVNDLNAMHEVEKTFDDVVDKNINPLFIAYIKNLRLVTGYSLMNVTKANALQRAEAYLRTIGKYTDS